MKLIAKPYQLTGIRFLINYPFSALFADPGLGKTIITLSTLCALRQAGYVDKILIIAPILVVHDVWPKEASKFEQFRHLRVGELHGKKKNEVYSAHASYDILCVNPEGLKWFFDKGLPPGYDTLIIDESSMFKSASSKRFGLLEKHMHLFRRRHLLTGTPSADSHMDLYAQCKLLDYGKALGSSMRVFREKYCVIDNPEYRTYKIAEGAEKRIERDMRHLCIRFDEGLLDLPEKVINTIRITLPQKAMKIYKQMEKLLFAAIDESTNIIAPTAAAKYTICRQLANGKSYKYSTDAEGNLVNTREVLSIHSEKINALNNILDELNGKPCLVVYYFKHDLEALQDFATKRYGSEVPNIGSGVNRNLISQYLDAWNNKQLPLLLCHPQSVSYGLNMQSGGNDIVWYSLIDRTESYLQLNKRLHRMGVKGQVRIHNLVSAGTIDSMLLYRLTNKAASQQDLLNSLREYRKGTVYGY